MRPSALVVLAVVAVAIYGCESIPDLTFPDGSADASGSDASGSDASGSDASGSDATPDDAGAVDAGPFGCPLAPVANVTCCGAQACVGNCTPAKCTECAKDCQDLGQVCCAKTGKNKCAKTPADC